MTAAQTETFTGKELAALLFALDRQIEEIEQDIEREPWQPNALFTRWLDDAKAARAKVRAMCPAAATD